jgi:hypothetical protein
LRRHRFVDRRHFRRGAPFAFGFAAPYFHDYGYAGYAYDDCERWQQVRTPYGWQWMRVDVCDYY